MLEPAPGTQSIYEYISDCAEDGEEILKVYPPNSTVIVYNTCPYTVLGVLGEVTKLIVEHNSGCVALGRGLNGPTF